MLKTYKMLHKILENVLCAVADQAHKDEEQFFEGIEENLNNLCEAIAAEADADSAAIFFVTEENPPNSIPFMVMRGAAGRLRFVFKKYKSSWRKWRKDLTQKRPNFSGFAYSSGITDEFLALDGEERKQIVNDWSVTNQIWHLGQGRIANSNRAMDELHGGLERRGCGDKFAYPGETIDTTFRTMIGVPIFIQGATIQNMSTKENEKEEKEYPSSASSSQEFMSKYRVIGILKVEGKKFPSFANNDLELLKKKLTNFLTPQNLNLNKKEFNYLHQWLKTVQKNILIKKDYPGEIKFPDLIHLLGSDFEGRFKALIICKKLTDMITRCFHAEFSRQDMELLVLLSMQVGRLIIRRIVKYAASKDIIISENEIGTLNIRWKDIDHLVALYRAADAATQKVKHHLETLKNELDFTRRQEIYRTRISELLDPHGPIREISARRKEYISLIRKMVLKAKRFEENPYNCIAHFTTFNCDFESYSNHSGDQCIARGRMKLFLHRPTIGKGEIDAMAHLGMEGTPQVKIDKKNMPVALEKIELSNKANLNLVQRVLDPHIYNIDDLAGARIITDYDSDLDEVIDEIRGRVREWGIELGKIDDQREGKEGGYRAVHITVFVDVEKLLDPVSVNSLREAFKIPEEKPLPQMPMEIQLRTAYHHSWALKTHGISYKREEQISQDLRDEQEILSNVLAEADWLSDIVRSNIRNFLLPFDYGENTLIEFLKRRIPRDNLMIIKFGISCAKEMLKDNLRYSGKPEYSFSMEVCQRLVYNFKVLDSNMLLLALLRNIWRHERGEAEWLRKSKNVHSESTSDEIIHQLYYRLDKYCPITLSTYRKHLNVLPKRMSEPDWLMEWLQKSLFPTWFWAILRSFQDYFEKPPEDRARQWKERLKKIYTELKQRHVEGQGQESRDIWLEHAYVMEAAILLANLNELPFQPGTARRKRLHNEYISLFREIRKYLPNGPTKKKVVNELESALRETETVLDLVRKPEWWSA